MAAVLISGPAGIIFFPFYVVITSFFLADRHGGGGLARALLLRVAVLCSRKEEEEEEEVRPAVMAEMPRLQVAESGRLEDLEKFSHYVGQ
jgi:hypothetical protein